MGRMRCCERNGVGVAKDGKWMAQQLINLGCCALKV